MIDAFTGAALASVVANWGGETMDVSRTVRVTGGGTARVDFTAPPGEGE